MIIKPTIGRVVWYWKNIEAQQTQGAQPFAALVTYVHSDELVNLATFDRNGDTYPVVGVPLYQGEGQRPSGKHCEWMPYQKTQAAKQEASTAEVIGLEALVSRIAAIEKAQIEVADALKPKGGEAKAFVPPPASNTAVPIPPLASSQSTNSVPHPLSQTGQ